ncbi:hypothetical protein CGQ24_04265 [Arthrobacter sp. 7749]|nr:hypothetical protein CGQ24_04265 [Arthrobacter sp. 7749]
MGAEMSTKVLKLGHIGGRTFLMTAAIIAAIAGLFGVLYLAWFTEEHFTRSFVFEAWMATPMNEVPQLRGSIGESHLTYGSAFVESDEKLFGPRLFLAISEALYFLLFIAGCAAIIMICRRLWKNHPFTALAHWAMLVLGAMAGMTALFAPWLADVSTHLAAAELGIPGTATQIPENAGDVNWLVTSAEFSFQDANHPLLALGVVLILLSLVLRRGQRLHLDADGLV